MTLPINPIINALRAGDRMLALTLIQYANPKELSHCDTQGQTPLHIAIQKGYFEVVEALISRGAKLSVPQSVLPSQPDNFFTHSLIEGFYRKIVDIQNSSVTARNWMNQKIKQQENSSKVTNVIDFMAYKNTKILKRR